MEAQNQSTVEQTKNCFFSSTRSEQWHEVCGCVWEKAVPNNKTFFKHQTCVLKCVQYNTKHSIACEQKSLKTLAPLIFVQVCPELRSCSHRGPVTELLPSHTSAWTDDVHCRSKYAAKAKFSTWHARPILSCSRYHCRKTIFLFMLPKLTSPSLSHALRRRESAPCTSSYFRCSLQVLGQRSYLVWKHVDTDMCACSLHV